MSMVQCLIDARQKLIDGKSRNEKMSYIFKRMQEFRKTGLTTKESFDKATEEWKYIQEKYFKKK
jgi:hypothetical protein